MYKCENCNYEFEEPKEYSGERLEYWGFPCHEIRLGCPICYGNYYQAVIID